MKYENQRPDLADQIKALVQSANSVKTVPHGIKTVNPGEGLQLVSGDGQEIFWDWETAAEYDTRISEGRAAIDQAQAELAQARLDLDAAAARVTENRQLLDALGPRVDAAQSQVTQTAKDLTSVDTRLTTTAGELSTLKGTVGDVSAAVADADRKAAQAVTSAATAQEAAETAMTEYDGLRVKLDAALAARPGLITDSSFELADQWAAAYGASIIASTAARTGSKLLVLPWQNTNTGTGKSVHAYSGQDVQVIKGNRYRLTVYLNSTGSLDGAKGNFLVRRGAAGSNAYVTNTTITVLADSGITQGEWRVFQADWVAPESYDVQFGFQARDLTSDLYVDDLQAVDATAEASLQIAVEDARQKAEAAARDAVEAMRRADMAQSSANGKTNVMYTTTPYTGAGLNIGDTNFVLSTLGGGGIMQRQRRWGGNSWEDVTLGHQVISSVDLGKATVGELDGIRIKANSVTADKVTIGIGQNLIPNANATSGIAPHTFYGGGTKTVAGSMFGPVFFSALDQGSWGDAGVIRSGSRAPNGRNGDFLINPTSEYVFRLRAKRSWGTGTARVRTTVFDINGTAVKTVFSMTTALTATWSAIEVRLTGADVAAGVSAGIFIQTMRDGEYWFEALDFRELTDGALIVNGTITGDKVHAESVAAKVGQFVKVQANNVEVTDDLSARVVNAMTTNTKNLVVTESAILQHTTLLGTTVADELNVRKLLRGRDAIFDGTVDVAQLNVTGSMSAEIVRTMDAQTKNLVVTEDAIINRATVVQSLVTPELISEKANIGDLAARLVTSGLLQTSTAANRGVKIDNSGIRAWDTAGKQTVQINGTNNYLTGTFATAEKEQRVEIKTGASNAAADFYGSTSTTDHLGVWHQSDIGADSVSKIISFNQIAQHENSPGMLMYPFRGEFTFAGRWARESDTVKFFFLQNSVGLAGGAWVDLTYRYAKPFTTLYSYRMPFLSVEAETGRDCIAMVRTQTASEITFRVVNKSAGPSGSLVARGVVFNMNSEIYNRYW